MSQDRKARYRDISEGLLRQRRNLLLISIIMPLFFLSGAAVEKINILGTIIEIKDPSVIKGAILLLFGYFFLRYWQYYGEETYVKDMYERMKRHLFHREQMYLRGKAREKAKFLDGEIFSIYFANPKYTWTGQYAAIPNEIDRVPFLFSRECHFYIYPTDNGYSGRAERIKEFHLILSRPEYSNWHPINVSENADDPPSFYRESLQYSIIQFHLMRLWGAIRYMLSESYFTDYQLPFIVALTSVAITAPAVLR